MSKIDSMWIAFAKVVVHRSNVQLYIRNSLCVRLLAMSHVCMNTTMDEACAFGDLYIVTSSRTVLTN